MHKLCFLILFDFSALFLCAQADTLAKTRFVIGLSAPELLHTGINIDLGKSNQVGISAGIGPSWGTVWPTLNIEHRFYFGRFSESINRRKWFFRQGATYFTAGKNQSVVSLSAGADLKSKSRNKGWTIDLGGFILFQNYRDRENMLFPALRFQFYNYLKKGRK